MIWLALSVLGVVLLHFVPRDGVRETMAASLALASLGVFFIEAVAHIGT